MRISPQEKRKKERDGQAIQPFMLIFIANYFKHA
jgi:hypothetical protein